MDGLTKSCVFMCGGNAARDRLKRLKEGRHPYKNYKHLSQFLGPLGEGWAASERPLAPPPCGVIGGNAQGLAPDVGESTVLGQDLSARDHADLLTFLRYENELEAFAFGAGGGAVVVGLDVEMEVDDPFGFADGDFESP